MLISLNAQFSVRKISQKITFGLMLYSLVCGYKAMATESTSIKDTVMIAGVKANWGAPAPFLHAKKGPGYAISTFVFDSLVWRDKKGEFVPAVADSWTVSDDQKIFRFTLNANAKWHDGKPLTTDDVVFTLDYLKKHPYVFADIGMVSEVIAGQDNEIVIKTKTSFPAFMSNIATALPILPKHIYKDVENPIKYPSDKPIIGSGPYQVATYDRVNKSYLFKGFSDYHRGKPSVSEIAIQAVAPPAVMKMVKSTEVDFVTSVAPKQKKALIQEGFKLLSYPATHPVRLKFNFTNPLFKKLAVRQAFAKGINRQAIIDKAYHKQAELWSAGGLHTLADDKKDSEIVQYEYDANALNGVIPADTTLKLVTDKRIKKAAQVIAAQLKNEGISVDLVVTERGAANAMFRKGDYDLGLVSFSLLGDPIIFHQTTIGKRIDGDQYTDNEQLNQLLKKQISETNTEKRTEMIRQASIIYAKELPSVSLVSAIKTIAYRPESLQPYWHGYGLGRGIPIMLDKAFFAVPFQ